MDKFVDYKEVPFGDKVGWDVEYEPVWTGEGKVMSLKPKNENVRSKRAKVTFINYVPIYGGKGNTKIVGGFYYAKPAEKRGLYDLYIDNHIDIPDSISKDSPCYKQFMKEKENAK